MQIRKADDVPSEPVAVEGARGVTIRLLIHAAQGAPNFYMRQFNLAPGGHTPLHSHDWEHEVYVLAGSGEVVACDGGRPVRAGDCVFVPGGEDHQFRNTGRGEMKFLCLIPKA